jgi:hypothetical protein
LSILFDLEEEELVEFPWDEERKVLPVVMPKVKKKREDEEKDKDN